MGTPIMEIITGTPIMEIITGTPIMKPHQQFHITIATMAIALYQTLREMRNLMLTFLIQTTITTAATETALTVKMAAQPVI